MMKKNYIAVEFEFISLIAKDVITTSQYGYDPDNILGNNKNDSWNWENAKN